MHGFSLPPSVEPSLNQTMSLDQNCVVALAPGKRTVGESKQRLRGRSRRDSTCRSANAVTAVLPEGFDAFFWKQSSVNPFLVLLLLISD